MTAPVRLVPCPTCRKPAAFSESNRWRPFCSVRCRNGDFSAWATESYRVPAAVDPTDEEDPEAG